MTGQTHIDLSHVITHGMATYPGLPTPVVADHLTREAAEGIYGPGITFQIGVVTLCTNTGTYLDVPFHRYADGHDLTALALDRVAGVEAVRLDCSDRRAIELDDVDLGALTGKAVLIWTGHSRHWGTETYFSAHPALPAGGFTFTAVPPKIEGAGTFTVLAYATLRG